MKPLAGRIIAFLALLAIPTVALAQKEPPDTKELKEASKYLGLAMMQSAPDKKAPYYKQAMDQLRIAMTSAPNNGKVWLYAGQVYAGMGDFAGADSAFSKAEQLHPPYAEDIAGEREAAWVEAFNQGISLMDQRDNAGAIEKMEMAEKLYPHRPESKMNLGALYAALSENDKAISKFEEAIASINGPLREKLGAEDQATWARFETIAKNNIAQLHGARGVEAFNVDDYDAAYDAFTKAAAINQYSRDYVYNQAQALYAKASDIEEKRNVLLDEESALKRDKKEAEAKAKADAAAALEKDLIPLYARIIETSEKTRAVDPNNESLYHLIARSQKLTSDFMKDAAGKTQWQNKALETLTLRDGLEFEVAEVVIAPEEGQTTVSGSIKNLKVAANAPIKLKFTLIGVNGSPVGEGEITVNAPAAEAAAPFQGTIATSGDVAGWKYVPVK